MGMKSYCWIGLAEAAMWLSVGAAIMFALYLTGKASVLWFFIIPLIGGYSVKINHNTGTREASHD